MDGEARTARRIRLVGRESASVDGKGRLFLDQKKRDSLGESFSASYSASEGCLWLIPDETFDSLFYSADNVPITPERNQYVHNLSRYMEPDISCDKQGRLVLPRHLRELAELDGPVTLVGQVTFLQIWNNERLASHEAEMARRFGADPRLQQERLEEELARLRRSR